MSNSQINSHLQMLKLCLYNRKRILSIVISRSYPFAFQYAPESFGWIKFWRVWWKIADFYGQKHCQGQLPFSSQLQKRTGQENPQAYLH